MRKSLDVLPQLQIAAPCSESWANMRGDDRRRHCEKCGHSVVNISSMRRASIEEVISDCNGPFCVRIETRENGTIITRDVYRPLRTALRSFAWVASLIGFFSAAGCYPLVTMGAVKVAHSELPTADGERYETQITK